MHLSGVVKNSVSTRFTKLYCLRLILVVVRDQGFCVMDCAKPVLNPGPKNVNFEPLTHIISQYAG